MLEGLAVENMEEGKEIPKALQNIPDIEGLEWVMEAFFRLSSCRSVGMTRGPIPWTAVKEYSFHIGVFGYAEELLFKAIEAMDAFYLSEMAAKDKNNGNRNTKS